MRKFKAETIVARLFAAMQKRRQALIDGEFVVSAEIGTASKGIMSHLDPEGSNYRGFLHAVNQTKGFFDFEPLMNTIEKHKGANAQDSTYIQCKTIEKIIKFVKAFGHADFRMLDNHTRLILVNCMYNNGMISSRAGFATLCKVEFDALDTASAERYFERSNYSHGTANAQLSSTKETFRVLGVTNGVKGERDAKITFSDEAKAAFVEHFAPLRKVLGLPDIERTDDSDAEDSDAE